MGVRDRPWLPWPAAADEADVLLHKIVVLLGPCQSVTGFYGQLRVALVIHYAQFSVFLVQKEPPCHP